MMSLLLFWWIFSAAPASLPASLPFPLDAPEEGRLVATDTKGRQRWRSRWSMEPLMKDGLDMVRLTEEGQGVYSPFKKPVRWSFESWWLAGPPLQPSRVEKRIRDLEGNLLLTRTIEFDWEAGRARVESRRGQSRPEVKTVAVPPGTWIPEGMAVALRQMDFQEGKTLHVHLLTDEPKLYKVRFKGAGRETVNTPDGPLECYKLRMEVELGFLTLFKFLLPDTYLWFGVDPPHMWVRYQGLESGRGSPKIVRSMTSFTRRAPQN
ncbi:MAG: DUF3108 domain-containing protein [Acidobacteriota bacterium]